MPGFNVEKEYVVGTLMQRILDFKLEDKDVSRLKVRIDNLN